MINTWQELIDKLNSIDCGKAEFELIPTDGSISIVPLNKLDLSHQLDTNYWLENNISNAFNRVLDREKNVWAVKWNVLPKIKTNIIDDLFYIICKCSDAKEPTRTKLFKDWKAITYDKNGNPEMMTDVISILNYYYSATTDQTRNSNVIGLLTILRKKYGATAARS